MLLLSTPSSRTMILRPNDFQDNAIGMVEFLEPLSLGIRVEPGYPLRSIGKRNGIIGG